MKEGLNKSTERIDKQLNHINSAINVNSLVEKATEDIKKKNEGKEGADDISSPFKNLQEFFMYLLTEPM